MTLLRLQTRIGTGANGFHQTKYEHSEEDLAYIIGTGYDYPDLPGLGSHNEKLGLPERLSTGIHEYNSGSGTYFTEKNRVIVILFVRITLSYYYPE